MKKALYILPVLALGLAACSNEEESIFDQSAAERLEAGQKEYFSTLCADGGIWAMEYFANEEEPGYMFVMQFHADKSVDVHTDHKWIGSKYRSERSLWDVINDNGNVLTFNSYNTLFHVFSTPENIEGSDAPLNSNGEDVDEQGYGHDGDYEFMLMENSNGNIRLLGKKRGYYAYLRHLPSDTDPKAYLADIAAKRKLFANKKFPTYIMTETATGAEYDVTGLGSGVVSIMPSGSTNPYAQTETKACVITANGLRPIKAFDCIRSNDSHFGVDEFTWASDGALVAPGMRITATNPATNLSRQELNWAVDTEHMSAKMVTAYEKANSETESLKGMGRKPKIADFSIGYTLDWNTAKYAFALSFTVGSGKNAALCAYTGNLTKQSDGTILMEFNSPNEALELDVLSGAPAVLDFLKLFNGKFKVQNITPVDASKIVFNSVEDSEISYTISLK